MLTRSQFPFLLFFLFYEASEQRCFVKVKDYMKIFKGNIYFGFSSLKQTSEEVKMWFETVLIQLSWMHMVVQGCKYVYFCCKV